MVVMLALLMPLMAFADEPSQTTPEQTNTTYIEVTPSTETDSKATTIADETVPLSIKPYEYGWALFNLLATVLTVGIAIILAITMIVNKKKGSALSNNVGLSVFALVAAGLSVVLYFGTEPPLDTQMLIVDSYSVAHVSVLAVAILCAALSVKKDVKNIVSR
jgi:drug/metabolite transporter (DMT)-like permease